MAQSDQTVPGVVQGARRRGLGSRLLLQAEQWCRKQKCTSMCAAMTSGYSGAMEFYQTNDYEIMHAKRSYLHSTTSARMEKKLEKKDKKQ